MKNMDQLKREISDGLTKLCYGNIYKEYYTYRNEILSRDILKGNEDELLETAEKDFKEIEKKIEDFKEFLFYEI
jgi:hypothetical protein